MSSVAAQSRRCVTVMWTERVMGSRETIAVYAKNDTKTIKAPWEQNTAYIDVNMYNLKPIRRIKVLASCITPDTSLKCVGGQSRSDVKLFNFSVPLGEARGVIKYATIVSFHSPA